MKDVIKKVPIPLCGVMLGAAALGNLLQSYSEGIRYVCGIFAAFLLILVLLKLIMFPGAVKEDMGNPIMASVSGTFPMALMILSTYVKPFIGKAAYYMASGNHSSHHSDHILYGEVCSETSDAKSICKLLYWICRNCCSGCYSTGL